MAKNGPLRRRIDERPEVADVTIPTPAAEPVPAPALRDMLTTLLDSAHEARRSITFVVAEARGIGHGTDISEVVRPIIRGSDVVWRTGPREIAVVLVDADGPSAESAVARLRDRLGTTTRLGVALGRATAAPGIAANDLIALAKANLLGLRH